MSVEKYLNQPYKRSFTLINEESKTYWYGRIQELNGCYAIAKTEELCKIKLEEALKNYIETKIKEGKELPAADGINRWR